MEKHSTSELSRRALLKSALALASFTALSACGSLPSMNDEHGAAKLKKKLAIREIENVWIPLADGRKLAARIWLPINAESAPVPAILEYLPYRQRDLSRYRHEPAHVYAAACGYAGVRVDISGSGDSDGLLHDEYLAQEQLDGLEVLKWLAAQPWCTGSVGMRGISWGGFNGLQIAALQPPELKAIITHCSSDDRFTTYAHYLGGSLTRANFEWSQFFMNVLTLPPDPEIFGPDWKKEWLQRLDNIEPVAHTWLQHQRKDSYWQHGSVSEDYSQIKCPVYAVGGYVDGYTNTIPRLLEHLDVPKKGLIGTWGHAYPDSGKPGPGAGFLYEEVRWWDQWLKGVETGIMEEPMLHMYMQEQTPGEVFPEDIPGRWVAEREWPPARIKTNNYFLNTTGLAKAAESVETRTLAPDQTIGLKNQSWLPFDLAADLPRDQTEDDNKSLSFDSEVLDKAIEICGHASVKLTLSVNKPVARVAVRLGEVDSDGSSWHVTGGYLNLTHRDGHEQPQALIPGKVYEVEVPLNFIAYRFKVGRKIRLAISESYWPLLWPSPEPVELTLHTGVSQLLLPERPLGSNELENITFTNPVPSDHSVITPTVAGNSNKVLSEPDAAGKIQIKSLSDSGGLLINKTGTEMRIRSEWLSSVEAMNPNSSFWSGFYAMGLKRSEWDIETKADFELRSDKDNFYIKSKLEAREKGSIIFSKEWQDKIARDLG